MTEHKILVREMMAEDSEAVAALSAELGYPVSKSDLITRFDSIVKSSDNLLIVAEALDEVVGWCHVFCVRLLESDGYAELGGIVVNTDWRRRGAGRLLVSDAESWALSRGFTRLRAHSGSHREGAHHFYLSLGYDQLAPTVFQKVIHQLDSQPGDGLQTE